MHYMKYIGSMEYANQKKGGLDQLGMVPTTIGLIFTTISKELDILLWRVTSTMLQKYLKKAENDANGYIAALKEEVYLETQEKLEKKMTREQIAEAQKLASEFVPKKERK